RKQADEKFRERVAAAEERLSASNQRINELQRQRDPNSGNTRLLTPEQQAEYEKLLQEKVDARKDLRTLRAQLREDVDALGNRVKLLNMLGMPVVVALLALLLGAMRMFRRRSR